MSGKRGTASQLSKDGVIRDFDINQVSLALRDAVRVEQEAIPTLDGPATILRRKRTYRNGGPLPHPDDVRAVLAKALTSLERYSAEQSRIDCLRAALRRHLKQGWRLKRAFGYKVGRGAPQHRDRVRNELWEALPFFNGERLRRPELQFLKLALHRHVEFGLDMDQAFGYARAARGAAPFGEEREQRIACAVFKQRFMVGLHPESAGYEAGKRFGVGKTQALAAFKKHAFYARHFYEVERLRAKHPDLCERFVNAEPLTIAEEEALRHCSLWTSEVEQRLSRYYTAAVARRRSQDNP